MSFFLKSKRTPNSLRPKGARNLVLRADKQRRREEAEARQEAHNKLSLEAKITKALNRGGSVKELLKLARLKAQVELAKATNPSTKSA